jgi:TRAP-type C4-dicarboxylate transport system substrate-binding protein
MKGFYKPLKAAALACAFAVMCVSARADTNVELVLGSSHPEAATANRLIKSFVMPEITKRAAAADITVDWREAWSGTVCKPGECLKTVADGLLDVGDIQINYEAGKIPFAAFSFYVPFSSPDPRLAVKAARQAMAETPGFNEYLIEKYNHVPVSSVVFGDYVLLTTFEWNDFSELAGHKIAAGGALLPLMHDTGMIPVSGVYPEAYVSLQTGVYDGWFLPADAVVATKLEEVTKQAVELGLGAFTTSLITVNKDVWDGLPEELRDIIMEVGEEFPERLAEIALENYNAALKTMADAGLVVRKLDDETRKQWAMHLENIPLKNTEALSDDMPKDIIYNYIAAQEQMGYQFPRDWAAERQN